MGEDKWQQFPKWPSNLPHSQILFEKEIGETPKIKLAEIIQKSDAFPIAFPINSTRCVHLKTITTGDILEDHINSAYPLLHERALPLFVSFLIQKRRFGNTVERELYQNLTLVELLDRLLTKRAVSFVGPQDDYLLVDKSKGSGKWETVGTETEAPPLILQNCLSYDEIKMAALLSVSSSTYFIDNRGAVEDRGVAIGAIGPRLNKELVMEFREIVKTEEQNSHVYGYGQFFVPTMQGIFSNFYGEASLTYHELEGAHAFSQDRYIKVGDKYFDKSVYSKRIAIPIDVLLMESNHRAAEVNSSAFLHVEGLGLGEWQIVPEQTKLFVETFAKRIKFLGPSLNHISVICFSRIDPTLSDYKIVIDGHPSGGIKLSNFDREPNAKLTGDDAGKLLVVSYNWNGNALPGNEFWLNNLTSSDGAAAASYSQIAELHNPLINSRVRGANLRIVTINGVVSFKDYLEAHKND